MLFSNYSINTQAEAQDSFLLMVIHIMSIVLGILGYPSDALNSDTEINCDCLLPGGHLFKLPSFQPSQMFMERILSSCCCVCLPSVLPKLHNIILNLVISSIYHFITVRKVFLTAIIISLLSG